MGTLQERLPNGDTAGEASRRGLLYFCRLPLPARNPRHAMQQGMQLGCIFPAALMDL